MSQSDLPNKPCPNLLNQLLFYKSFYKEMIPKLIKGCWTHELDKLIAYNYYQKKEKSAGKMRKA